MPGHEDEGKTTRCSTCNNATLRKRYKCLSCDRFDLCKSCYSQVHEIHPSHVFLEVRSAKDQAKSEAESNGHINEPVHPAAEPCALRALYPSAGPALTCVRSAEPWR
jgi:hypothetical protein